MDHAGRRQRLIDLLDTTGIVLLIGHTAAARDYAADHYPFRQDASFRYFIGLDEPGAAAVIDLEDGTTTVFADEPDLDDVIWHGPRPPIEHRAGAARAERHLPLSGLPPALAGREVHVLPATRPAQAEVLESLVPGLTPSRDLIRSVARLREVKDDLELAEIEQAVGRSEVLHRAAMAAITPGRDIAEVARELGGVVVGTGGEWAYSLIFTNRGEVLHQWAHTGTIDRDDLVLHDGGITSDAGYASDITRTMPASGRFDGFGRTLYEIVLDAQEAAFAAIAPGVPWAAVHAAAARSILGGFADVGLCSGDLDAAAAEGAYGVVFPHGVGHLLGIEVHDMEGLGEDLVGYDETHPRSTVFGPSNLRYGKPVREGMVLTVEPGAYFIGPLIERWRAEHRFAGFWDYDRLASLVGVGGVRVEDEIVVTATGCRVLGPAIPRTAAEVEAAMR